jgi:hypothetical protein
MLYLTVRSTTDTLETGTRKAIPVSFPLRAGMTLPTALAAPVEAGMMFWAAPRPSRHSYEQKKLCRAHSKLNTDNLITLMKFKYNLMKVMNCHCYFIVSDYILCP